MNFTEITYSKTKNLGNYESEKVEITAQIEENDDVEEVINTVKGKVLEALGEKAKESKKKATKKATKKTTKKTAKKKDTSSEEKEEEEVEKPVFSLAEVKGLLKDVWKKKGRNIAEDILADFGVKKTDELDPKVYPEVVKEAQKCLK